MKPDERATSPTGAHESLAARAQTPDMKDPAVVLSLLEADQVVAAKREPFGRRKLSPGMQALLWGLRVYVAAMLVIVLISILRAV
ncbi:MAG TPA: hypothetical protein VN661_11965 [Candidatus Acidoferrales bacterium]|nr:hypothetical protein [Candidatus Acidoferrales bacterium]